MGLTPTTLQGCTDVTPLSPSVPFPTPPPLLPLHLPLPPLLPLPLDMGWRGFQVVSVDKGTARWMGHAMKEAGSWLPPNERALIWIWMTERVGDKTLWPSLRYGWLSVLGTRYSGPRFDMDG